nr:MAG TPA: hypothetical protein [Caudoviricetes sp.]
MTNSPLDKPPDLRYNNNNTRPGGTRAERKTA